MNENQENLANALVKAQAEMETASKDGENPLYKSGYATLEAVINAVKEPLNNNGIFFLQKSHLAEKGVIIETRFIGHGSELSAGKIFIPAPKDNPHGFGSALTYAKRFSLQTACGLPSSDDDGNSAVESIEKKPAPKKKWEKPEIKEVKFEELAEGVKDIFGFIEKLKKEGMVDEVQGQDWTKCNDFIQDFFKLKTVDECTEFYKENTSWIKDLNPHVNQFIKQQTQNHVKLIKGGN
jgi:hypothetical protein